MKTKSALVISALIITLLFAGINTQGAELDPDNYDLGGQTVTFVTFPWFSDIFEEVNPNFPEIVRLAEEAEEEFNINLETRTYGWGDYTEEVMTRILAGESSWDIYDMYVDHFWNFISEDALFPINRVLSEDYFAQFSVTGPELERLVGYGSEIYSISDPMSNAGVRNQYLGIFWNKDMFERNDLPNLYEMYEEGEWTWDNMTKVAEALTQDTTGDGEIDQVGIANWYNLFRAGHFTNNVNAFEEDDEGRIQYNLDHPDYKEWLEQLHEWFIDLDVITFYAGYPDMHSEFAEGNYGMMVERIRNGLEGLEDLEMEDEYGFVPLPKGPQAEEYVYPAPGYYLLSLPINAEEPEALTAIAHYIFGDWFPAEVMEEQMLELARDRETMEIWQEATEKSRHAVRFRDIMTNLVWPDYFFPVFVSAEEDLAALVQELKPEYQGRIDDRFGQ